MHGLILAGLAPGRAFVVIARSSQGNNWMGPKHGVVFISPSDSYLHKYFFSQVQPQGFLKAYCEFRYDI